VVDVFVKFIVINNASWSWARVSWYNTIVEVHWEGQLGYRDFEEGRVGGGVGVEVSVVEVRWWSRSSYHLGFQSHLKGSMGLPL
jgi:hypothetical protein